METYENLTEVQKEKVKAFINNNIDSVYDERNAYGTRIEQYSYGTEIEDDTDIKAEFIESEFVGYYCNKCGDYLESHKDSGLILHVIEHLKEEPDQYVVDSDKCETCKHLGKSVFNEYPPECYICDDCNDANDHKNYENDGRCDNVIV